MPLINFSGLASGIDSMSLIDAMLGQQRSARITPLRNKISALSDTNDALGSLSSLLRKLSAAADKFRTLHGGGVAKQARSSDEMVVTASASTGAASGSYNISVSSLAKNATASFDDRFASGDAVLNAAIDDGSSVSDRTVTVQVGQGAHLEEVSVELTSSTTVNDFITRYNEQATKSYASLVNLGTDSSPSYAVVIQSNETGTEKGAISFSVGSEITNAGSGTFTVSQATDAQFSISGIAGTITRSSNTVTDLLPGVTLSLQSTGSSTITIAEDSAATASLLEEFVSAYNAVVSFIKEKDAVTQEQASNGDIRSIFGPLASTSLDENVLSTLRNALSSSSKSGGTINTLADLGITTQRDGSLAFDSTVFANALAEDSNAVRAITQTLGDTLAGTGGTIAQFTQFNGLINIAEQANRTQISSLEAKIATTEKSLSRQQETLTAQFARLESLIGQLNSQQQTLAALLPR